MKLLILDRDGVINQDSDDYIKSLEEWLPLPGAIDAMAALSKAGWTIAVATNQSGLARGYFNQATLDAMHAELQRLVQAQGGRVDAIHFCPHGPEDDCTCRKPLPGMIEAIGRQFNADLTGVWLVGDSLRDLEAGLAVGCQPVLVKTGKGLRSLAKPLPEGTLVFDDLAAVAQQLLTGKPD
ncbi:D-glycero-beta-D-manno-heptose 1,7-bisphosphate 7-phosphatase [Atopomonas sediminilitoris]|uniref:D-glycero-beta-D-manno-heptose 1,7-bisphosphate 7-phosphatase n=1 Tax=Atopomonas sediminilitoris TaxID=2919919 RepID=UPI001F4D837C|nr:D-glycero-beta-D-manno-heptose 1,7-bisphosphate 7-phosphatase [Atopomonas sediminilitoris]MCJ8169507.1 D-glycero-beta-D-manno-heptose 1,7-bisphosphate 7-phosphatase [Atopomonas sediminilitoris]